MEAATTVRYQVPIFCRGGVGSSGSAAHAFNGTARLVLEYDNAPLRRRLLLLDAFQLMMSYFVTRTTHSSSQYPRWNQWVVLLL